LFIVQKLVQELLYILILFSSLKKYDIIIVSITLPASI